MNIQSVNEAVTSLVTKNPWIILLIIWTAVWKLIALWKAAKHNHLTVFIIFGILNDLGIAEIIYLVYLYVKGRKETKNI